MACLLHPVGGVSTGLQCTVVECPSQTMAGRYAAARYSCSSPAGLVEERGQNGRHCSQEETSVTQQGHKAGSTSTAVAGRIQRRGTGRTGTPS